MTVLTSKATLSPIEWLAVQIIGKSADKTRDEVKAGKRQEVDFLLRVHGTIDVSPDGSSTRTTSAKPSAELLLAHVRRNVSAEQWQAIEQAIRNAAAANAGALPAVEEGFMANVAPLVNSLTKYTTTTSTKHGPTKGTFEVGIVDLEQLSQNVTNTVVQATRSITFGDDT